jgi:4a-hydroxytetrahydrobiopterin dehydratase
MKDVDLAARIRLLRATVYLVPVGLFFSFICSLGFHMRGLSPLAALLAGFALGLGGLIFSYACIRCVLDAGPVGVINRLYGTCSTGTPHPVDSWRARALISRGDFATALDVLEREIAEDAGNPAPLLRAARLAWSELGDRDRAIDYYERAGSSERLGPETEQYVFVRLSELYLDVGMEAAAADKLRALLRRYPGSRYAPAARGRLAELVRRRRFHEEQSGRSHGKRIEPVHTEQLEAEMSTGDLASETCVPCRGGIPPMEEAETREMLAQTPGWELLENASRIRRRFQLEDFAAAIEFVEDIADIAEQQGHHPDLRISGRDVDVILWTHAIDGLHDNDFIMAAKINQLFEERS